MGFLDIFKRIFKKNTDQLLLDTGTPVFSKFDPIETYGVKVPVFDT